MKTALKATLAVSAAALLAGCATAPSTPGVAVMPAANKPFEVFEPDQGACKDYAGREVAGRAEKANVRTVAGTAIGASGAEGPVTIQARYDVAYVQCMYAKGNQVPGFAPAASVPPPPPNQPPPRRR